MKKSIIVFTLMVSLSSFAQSLFMQPGETRYVEGTQVTCGYPQVNSCYHMSQLGDRDLKNLLINGVGNCYYRSYRESPYRCTLHDSRGNRLIDRYADTSCYGLVSEIRMMMLNGQFDSLCGCYIK
jgi:hypothetical protein